MRLQASVYNITFQIEKIIENQDVFFQSNEHIFMDKTKTRWVSEFM